MSLSLRVGMKDVDGVMEMQLLLVMEGEIRALMNLIREYIAYN